MKKENTVIKEVPFITSPLEGEDACKAGEGVIHTVSPSFVLRTFSPSRGEINQGSIARGFTLIELLVVVLIIGILVAVAVPQYKKAILKSRVTEYEVNLKALAEAHQVYYLANGKNARNISTLDIEIPKCKGIPGKFSECSYEIFGGSMQGYFIMLTAGSAPVLGYSLPGIKDWNGVTKPDILVCVAYGKLSTSDCHSLGYTEQIGPSPVYAKP